MNLARVTNQPTEYRVGERTLKVSPGSVRQCGRIQAWLDTRPVPRHLRQPIPEGSNPSVVAAITKANREAAQGWPPDALSTQGVACLLGSEEGQLLLLECALARHHGDQAKDGLSALLDELTPMQFQHLACTFLGLIDPEEDGEKKAPSPTTDSPASESTGSP